MTDGLVCGIIQCHSPSAVICLRPGGGRAPTAQRRPIQLWLQTGTYGLIDALHGINN